MRDDPLLTIVVVEELRTGQEEQAPPLKPHFCILRATVALPEEFEYLVPVAVVVLEPCLTGLRIVGPVNFPPLNFLQWGTI